MKCACKPHNDVPYILQNDGVRIDVQNHVTKMAAAVDDHGPWVVDIEELEPPPHTREHISNLRMHEGEAPTLAALGKDETMK